MYTSSHAVQLLLLLLGGRLGSSLSETKVNGWAVKAPGRSSRVEDHPPPGILLFGVVPGFRVVYWEMARGFGSWNWGEPVCQLGRWGQWPKSRYILKSQVPLVLGNST